MLSRFLYTQRVENGGRGACGRRGGVFGDYTALRTEEPYCSIVLEASRRSAPDDWSAPDDCIRVPSAPGPIG